MGGGAVEATSFLTPLISYKGEKGISSSKTLQGKDLNGGSLLRKFWKNSQEPANESEIQMHMFLLTSGLGKERGKNREV